MRFVAFGGTLRLEQRCDEERMFHQLKGPHGAVGSEGAEFQGFMPEAVLQVGIHSVAALIRLDNLVGPIDFTQARIFGEEQRFGLIDERAGQLRNHWGRCGWCGFSVVGIRDVQDVAGEFNQGVLEAAASAEEGDSIFAGVADRGKRAFHFRVRTAGHAPDRRWALRGHGGGGFYFRGGQPFVGDLFSSQRERGGDALMREDGIVIVADQENLDHQVANPL